ncbi:MAG TPA: hypothetical protein VIH90_03050 [Candidatus Saccharimonadales bacterium]
MSNLVGSQPNAYDNLRNELPHVAPYLFNLADKVLGAAPEANWDVMLCDDVSGRLPAYFIRRVLAESGQPISTRFIAGSKAYHERFDPQVYRDYYLHLTAGLSSQVLNVLIVTEATHSGATLNYLKNVLTPVTHSIETAAAVNVVPRKLATDYTGGEGLKAGRLVRHAFETIRPGKTLDRFADRIHEYMPEILEYVPEFVRQHTPTVIKRTGLTHTHDLLSLGVSDEARYPQVSRTAHNAHTAFAYQTMEALVQSYCASETFLLMSRAKQYSMT